MSVEEHSLGIEQMSSNDADSNIIDSLLMDNGELFHPIWLYDYFTQNVIVRAL